MYIPGIYLNTYIYIYIQMHSVNCIMFADKNNVYILLSDSIITCITVPITGTY